MNDFETSSESGTAPRDRTGPAAARRAIGLGRVAAKPIRLRGLVRPGVERGSRLLLDDHGVVLAQLMAGPDVVLPEGATVTVVGVFRRDLLTTAQQGAPFQVSHAVAD